MQNLDDIISVLTKQKKVLHDNYGVSNIAIFGSYVRGDQREDSDLDILVEFDKPVDLLDVSGLKIMLSDLLHIDVDLTLKRSIRPEIKNDILTELVSL